MYALSFLGEAMVVFEAEISKGHGVTKWYKNGTEIKDNNRFKLKIDGKKQRLEIVKVWEADAGEYMCKIGNEKCTAKLTVEVYEIFFLIFGKDNIFFLIFLHVSEFQLFFPI